MKKTKNILWGIILVAAGVLFALNALEIASFDIFFDGWWTLFIIVPCGVGLFTEREKLGNLIGLTIGVILLLCCLEVLSFSQVWKLLGPAVIIVIGVKMVITGISGNKANTMLAKMKAEGNAPKVVCAAFSGSDLNYDGQVFDGAELTAVFGGVECNLKNAVIEKDCAIKVCAVFGGIDILGPPHVNVKVSSTSIFGGVDNEVAPCKDGPTIYISGTCLFGGVDIK